MQTFQNTIAKPIFFEGIGLHTGKKVTMRVFAAQANEGITFVRVDLEGNPTIKATISQVYETSRSTKLKEGNATVQTIEHFLAALYSENIHNVLIEIDSEELPILDGSSLPFIIKIREAGIKQQTEECIVYNLQKTIEYKDEINGVHLIATPADEFSVVCMIDYDSKVLGKQYAELEHIGLFKDQIASSRTFCFFKELEFLAENDLIKGGSLDNALVVVDNDVTEEELDRVSKTLNKPKVKVSKGFLNNTKEAGSNEPAKHKLLDIVGDLSLIGERVNMRIIAKKPGHYANTQFAKLIYKQILKQKKQSLIPSYDLNEKPLMDIEEIKKLLPHRYPFLLVDKVLDLNKSTGTIIGLKNVTGNEEFFLGHFPNNPVFPGVLQIEALAQNGGILALLMQDDPYGWDTYFLKIDNCKFKRMVFPGDTLILKMTLVQPIRRGICIMKGEAFVGDKVVCVADLVAKIEKRKN